MPSSTATITAEQRRAIHELICLRLIGVSDLAQAILLDDFATSVRKWLAEGLLERVEGHKPVEITQRSVIEVERVLGTVRESYPARRWSEALAAFLHDRDLLGQGWAREGVEQMRHGELVGC